MSWTMLCTLLCVSLVFSRPYLRSAYNDIIRHLGIWDVVYKYCVLEKLLTLGAHFRKTPLSMSHPCSRHNLRSLGF